jgi:hypothetical protein
MIIKQVTKMMMIIIISIIIFAFTGVYLKYASVSQQLVVPKLEDLVLRYRSLKMGAISCQQSIFLIFFCFFAGWGEHHGKQGWLQAGEDMCGCSRNSGAFRDSSWSGLQVSAGIHMKKYSHAHLYTHTLSKVQDVFATKE